LHLTTDRLELRVPTDDELTEVAVVAIGGIHELDERPYVMP
jgi:hypothetical protein